MGIIIIVTVKVFCKYCHGQILVRCHGSIWISPAWHQLLLRPKKLSKPVNNNLSKYAIEGMHFLTLTSACLHIRCLSVWYGGEQPTIKGKLEQTCLMIWRWNMPLRTQKRWSLQWGLTRLRNLSCVALCQWLESISESLSAYDESSNMKPESTAHTKKSSARDQGIMWTDLRLLNECCANVNSGTLKIK